jgi:hypothetical protein
MCAEREVSVEFAGDFETHLTVRPDGPRGADTLHRWAGRHGMKFTHIVLARGESPSQPMVTRQGSGVLSGELRAATALRTRLADDGFVVTRVKVEAAPWNQGVPPSDAAALGQPADRHFEHHAKLVLRTGADLTALAALAQRHGAHVSRNALRLWPDRRQERFVTQRCYRAGRASAQAALDALLGELTAGGYEIADVEQEYVVYDSNLALDAGWLDVAEGGVGDVHTMEATV